MNAVILSFDPNEKQSVICERNYEMYGSSRIRSARKAEDKLHKACGASETCEQTLHGQEQNRMHMASLKESRDSDRFLVNTQVQSMHCCAEGLALHCLSLN